MDEIVIADRYVGREVLGEGSVARTLKAVDRTTGAVVAVKVLYPARMTSARDFERFEMEAEALRGLDHAAIPRYIDHFPWEEQGSPVYCLVQEFREGKSLEQALNEGRRFSEAETLAIARQILLVLRYLAAQKPPLVHRDLKPANLILGDQGDVALVDFGGVREAVRQTIRAGSTVIGTFGYMPPEQLVGRVSPGSDLFALGMTLLRVLTRRPVAELSSDGFSVDLAALELGVSEGVRTVLGALLEPHEDERYAHADEVLEDLEDLRQERSPQNATRRRNVAERTRRSRERERLRNLRRNATWAVRVTLGIFGLIALGAFAGVVTVLRGALPEDGAIMVFGMLAVLGTFAGFAVHSNAYLARVWEPPGPHWVEGVYAVLDRPWNQAGAGSNALGPYAPGPHMDAMVRLVLVEGDAPELPDHVAMLSGLPVGAQVRVVVDPRQPSHVRVELSEPRRPRPLHPGAALRPRHQRGVA